MIINKTEKIFLDEIQKNPGITFMGAQERTKKSRGTVVNAIYSLLSKGLVRSDIKPGGGRNRIFFWVEGLKYNVLKRMPRGSVKATQKKKKTVIQEIEEDILASVFMGVPCHQGVGEGDVL